MNNQLQKGRDEKVVGASGEGITMRKCLRVSNLGKKKTGN